MCSSTSGAGSVAPSSPRKQRPHQGLLSVVFTHLCTWGGCCLKQRQAQLWPMPCVIPKARRLWWAFTENILRTDKFHSSEVWSSWLRASVNKPIEYTEWSVSKQKNTQSRFRINRLMIMLAWEADRNLHIFPYLLANPVTLWNITTARSDNEKNLLVLIICVTDTTLGFPRPLKVIKTIWEMWKWDVHVLWC